MSLTQKQPFIKSLNRINQNSFSSLQQLLKKGLPATVVEVDKTGTIATVQFEVDSQFTLPKVKMPIYGPEFVRWPLQKGAKGVVMSSDLSTGGMSGLGEGVATLTPQFNLSTGVFFPIGNTGFKDTDDPQKTVLYGPDGVIIRTLKGDKGNITVDSKGVALYADGNKVGGTPSGNYVTITDQGFQVFIGGTLKLIVDGSGLRMIGGPGAGTGNFGVTVTPTGTHIDNINFLPHVHSNVTTGPNNTAGVNIVASPTDMPSP
jgi:hypothetical protein